MRLFLSVPLAEDIREALIAMQDRLKAADADVRWSPPENFHLTVAFLGDIPDSLLPEIEVACAEIAETAAPFRIRVRGGSFFPKRGPIVKTAFAGIAEGAEEWQALAARTISSMRVFGAPPNNDLVPHLTLGRVKGERNQAALREAIVAEAQTELGAQEADRLTLVQSFLEPGGATYRDRGSWQFGVPVDGAAR